jgi:hypothetical protein
MPLPMRISAVSLRIRAYMRLGSDLGPWNERSRYSRPLGGGNKSWLVKSRLRTSVRRGDKKEWDNVPHYHPLTFVLDKRTSNEQRVDQIHVVVELQQQRGSGRRDALNTLQRR